MIATRENGHMERTTTVRIQAVFGYHIIVGIFDNALYHPVHQLHRWAISDQDMKGGRSQEEV
jgi:hypothetical protein